MRNNVALTLSILVARAIPQLGILGPTYAVALPAYVATEVLLRGLIALRATRTPLITNLIQLAGRTLIIAWLVGRIGVIAITATVETLILGTVLLWRLRR
jgi:putative peptidoglycan lipid II flippase